MLDSRLEKGAGKVDQGLVEGTQLPAPKVRQHRFFRFNNTLQRVESRSSSAQSAVTLQAPNIRSSSPSSEVTVEQQQGSDERGLAAELKEAKLQIKHLQQMLEACSYMRQQVPLPSEDTGKYHT